MRDNQYKVDDKYKRELTGAAQEMETAVKQAAQMIKEAKRKPKVNIDQLLEDEGLEIGAPYKRVKKEMIQP